MSYEIDLNRWIKISDLESSQRVFPYCPTDDPVVAWNEGGLRLQRQQKCAGYYLALRIRERRTWCIDPFPVSLELDIVVSLHDGRDIGVGHFFIKSEGVDFLKLSYGMETWIALRSPPTSAVSTILSRRFPGCAVFWCPE